MPTLKPPERTVFVPNRLKTAGTNMTWLGKKKKKLSSFLKQMWHIVTPGEISYWRSPAILPTLQRPHTAYLIWPQEDTGCKGVCRDFFHHFESISIRWTHFVLFVFNDEQNCCQDLRTLFHFSELYSIFSGELIMLMQLCKVTLRCSALWNSSGVFLCQQAFAFVCA